MAIITIHRKEDLIEPVRADLFGFAESAKRFALERTPEMDAVLAASAPSMICAHRASVRTTTRSIERWWNWRWPRASPSRAIAGSETSRRICWMRTCGRGYGRPRSTRGCAWRQRQGLPGHLLFTKGWPTVMPTHEEAALIADVRRDVAAAVGLQVH